MCMISNILQLQLYKSFPEIPNFLTSDECDHFIQAAKKQGLQQSVTHQNIQSRSKNFRIYDLNKDKKLSVREV